MKKLSIILFILFCGIKSFCQIPNQPLQGNEKTAPSQIGGYGANLGFIWRQGFADTLQANAVNGGMLRGQIGIAIRVGNKLYMRDTCLCHWSLIASEDSTGFNSSTFTVDRSINFVSNKIASPTDTGCLKSVDWVIFNAKPDSVTLVRSGDSIETVNWNGGEGVVNWFKFPYPSGGSGWLTTGNSGTDSVVNFIGTTDAKPLMFRVNNDTIAKFATQGITFFTDLLSGGNRVALGSGTIASGTTSTALGDGTTASAPRSTAMGESTTASGQTSTAMGGSTIASGTLSTAMGSTTVASGDVSTAMGESTVASGYGSTSMGEFTKSKSYGGTVVGIYNDSTNAADPVAPNDANRIFQIGNGTADNFRSNAMTVLGNGNVGIGTTTPQTVFDCSSTTSGLLPPRMTEAQKNAIGTPHEAEQIYQTDGTAGYYYYNGAAWVGLSGGGGNTIYTADGTISDALRTVTGDELRFATNEVYFTHQTFSDTTWANTSYHYDLFLDHEFWTGAQGALLVYDSASTFEYFEASPTNIKGQDILSSVAYFNANQAYIQLKDIINSGHEYLFADGNDQGIKFSNSVTNSLYEQHQIDGSGTMANSAITWGTTGNLTTTGNLIITNTDPATVSLHVLAENSSTQNVFVAGRSGFGDFAWIDYNGNLEANSLKSDATVITAGYTVASLPSGIIGMTAYVTDALLPSYLTPIVGGGTAVTPVFYDGTNWIAH